MANTKICPVMSRPVVLETEMDGYRSRVEVYWVYCDENCQWWDKERQECKRVVTTTKETIVLQP